MFTSWKSQNELLLFDRVNLAVNSNKETKGRVKMGLCYLAPDRVKLTVNSKKETNSRVKMGKESKWAKGQDGLQLFTPDRVKLAVNSKKNKQQGPNGPRVKMGFCYLPPERVKMYCCCLPPDRVKLTEQQERNKGQGQIGLKGVKLGLAHFDSETIESNWAKRSQVGPGSSGPGPFWLEVKSGQGVKMGQNKNTKTGNKLALNWKLMLKNFICPSTISI